MASSFKLNKHERCHDALGFYGNKTAMQTPGPGSYDPFPVINHPALRTSRPRYYPDHQSAFVGVSRGHASWKPEPFSLSRLQSEQPLVHYASATFWDWPEQKRRFQGRAPRSLSSAGKLQFGAPSDGVGEDAMARAPSISAGSGGMADVKGDSQWPGMPRRPSQPRLG
eukprot:TRINITY_DN54760_c0_g1_i1.p1 TRINITY_DN54760_c0_g1~~TRINITY_DN54760_c0_g1_i1.p1  ORF type:complete len:189 (+),score=17.06 TRINITY_DN54760_c0_g1_i1:64-567(+)